MSKEKLVPRLKFGGFMKDEWILKKVSDLANTTYGGGTPTTSVIEYWRGDIPWISSSDLVENNVHNVTPSRYITKEAINNSATKLVPKNSIAIVTRVGVGKLALVPFEYTASQDFLSISNINGNGLCSVYALYKLLQIVKNETQGTSIKGITKDKLLDKNLYIPANIEEQIKIGTFFKKIDEMIQLQRSKVNKVKDIKSAYLSEMFPKEGEQYPKRRFEGFTEPWEYHYLCKVTQITMGQSPDSINYTNNPKDFILIQGNSDMKNGRVVPRIWTTQVTKKADKGDLILSVRAPVGDIGKTDYDVVLGRGVASIKGNDFIYQTFKKKKEQNYWDTLTTGSTFGSINSQDLKNITIALPSVKEQEKIGQFFKNLDKQITVEEEKLSKLENLKQGYLNDMFV